LHEYATITTSRPAKEWVTDESRIGGMEIGRAGVAQPAESHYAHAYPLDSCLCLAVCHADPGPISHRSAHLYRRRVYRLVGWLPRSPQRPSDHAREIARSHRR